MSSAGFCYERSKTSAKDALSNLPLKPQRILIMTYGTRGDCQPYLALAIGLKDAGYTVAMVTNDQHEAFVQGFGIKCYPAFASVDKTIKESKVLTDAQSEGAALKFAGGLDKAMEKYKTKHSEGVITAWNDFKPELIVEGTFSVQWRLLATYLFKIPVTTFVIACILFNPKHMIFGLPTMPFGLHKYLISHALHGAIYDIAKNQDEETNKLYGFGKCTDIHKKKANIEFSTTPPWAWHFLQSPVFGEVLVPDHHPNFKFLPTPIIPSTTQEKNAKDFGEVAPMEKFIAAGKKPIYCGWGSMTCKSPEYMTELVSRAVMHSQQRAIVLGGWAELGLECLKKITKDEALIAYAAENIMFVPIAPHEWLFPRVACTVHHGGSGTVTAACRAGVPTVITPIFFDQFDYAHIVNQLGIGVGFTKQFQKTSAIELGDAIRKCVETPSMAEKAKEVGAKLSAEDGIKSAIQSIDAFWSDVVLSGQLLEHIEAEKASAVATPKAGWCSCLKREPLKSS